MELLKPFLQLIQLFFNPIILIPIIIILIIFVIKNKAYKESSYYQITKYPYLSLRYNTGRYGEYLTYKYLKHMEANGAKFLFNTYIPKGNGETSEIDVLMICSKGIFVFESKNYSGWIFGSENQKNWYQTLPAGRGRSHKEHFYNPIMQNRSHIKHLRTFLGEQIPMYSIIVFSDRCTLKSVQINSNDIKVINRYRISPVVSAILKQTPIDSLSENNISDIYNKLYPFTQVDEMAKAQHIANIHNNLDKKTVQRIHSTSIKPVVPNVEVTEPTTIIQTEAESSDIITVNRTAESSTIEAAENKAIEAVPTTPQHQKCPRCSGNLVVRTATRGTNMGKQFLGCSNYPKCRYIQNI